MKTLIGLILMVALQIAAFGAQTPSVLCLFGKSLCDTYCSLHPQMISGECNPLLSCLCKSRYPDAKEFGVSEDEINSESNEDTEDNSNSQSGENLESSGQNQGNSNSNGGTSIPANGSVTNQGSSNVQGGSKPRATVASQDKAGK